MHKPTDYKIHVKISGYIESQKYDGLASLLYEYSLNISYTKQPKFHYFDSLWICCCTTNPQRIEVMDFGLNNSLR